MALLDYLKRYHPNDHETYTMVTLNFTMHREIAKMLEEAAYQQLKLLENKQIGKFFKNFKEKQNKIKKVSFRKHARYNNRFAKYFTIF